MRPTPTPVVTVTKPALRVSALLIVFAVATIHLGIWMGLNLPYASTPWYGTLNGMSFSPYQANQSPLQKIYPTRDQIDDDLARIADKVKAVRTYSAIEGVADVPKLANRYGLKVTAGAWLDKDLKKNQRELDALIQLVNHNPNIDRVLVGNEVLLRRDLTVKQLTDYIDYVKQRVKIPVSTAEPRAIWMNEDKQADGSRFDTGDLAKHVDYITVHLLPYWERTPIDEAMPYVKGEYDKLTLLFPDKKILVGEVGWPSYGSQFGGAVASRSNQSRFVREWVDFARKRNIDYFIMEAFDQPWKKANAGTVEAYWGLYTADRSPKYHFTTTEVFNMPNWLLQAGIATGLALLAMLWFAHQFRELQNKGLLFYSIVIQSVTAMVVGTAFVPSSVYMSITGVAMMSVMILAQSALLFVVLVNAFELTELLWRKDWQRSFKPLKVSDDRIWPKVSIHLACYNEPPELVMETLDSLAALDYPDFEVLVIDNNTKDPEVWKPLEAYCEQLGATRFRFFHLEPWPGFKAGALNYGVSVTDPAAQMVAVIDADYVVEVDWLKSLIPYFDNPKTGFVQAPQDHREWKNDTFKEMINWEYAGFFNIGMVHRNERNAIIQHGTMTIIRKQAMIEAGNWGEWCICEDTELGLRMMKDGFEAVYVNHVFGRGVTPDSFAAYKTQRFRWAYGAVQILRRYWRDMMPFNKKSPLTRAQKFHFVTGWLPWFADSLHLLFTVGAIVWSTGLIFFPKWFGFPMPIFLFSVLVLFCLKITHSFVLYTTRVRCSLFQRFGASLASISLTHIIGRAMIAGLFRPGKPFVRTPKGEDKPALMRGVMMAREETGLLIIMWLSAILVIARYGIDMRAAAYWALLLVIQALPYLAALVLSLINVWPHKGAHDDSHPSH